MTFAPVAMAPRLHGDSRWRGWAAWSFWTSIITLALSGVYGLGLIETGHGAMQRLSMAVPLIWVEAVSWRMLRPAARPHPSLRHPV